MMTRNSLWLAVGGAAAVVAVAVLLWAPWQAADEADGLEVTIDWRDDAQVAVGAEVYANQCADCHGTDLAGEPNWQVRGPDGMLPAPPHDETGHTWHHPDAQLFALTKYGPASFAGGDYRSAMPGYEGVLTDEEIAAVLAYIKRQWPPEILERHDQLNAANQP